MSKVRNGSVLCVIGFLVLSCGSTETQTVPAEQAPEQSPIGFQSTKDTVLTSRPPEETHEEPIRGERAIRYMVQIGAFVNPVNASRVQELARERFGIPVFNDYRSDLRLYQVRIGFFEERSDAVSFRTKLIRAFPEEYHDAWIVELLP